MSSDWPGHSPKTLLQSLADVYMERKPLLYRVVRRIVGAGEAEDILQEAFLQSYNAARNRKITNPQAFMLVTARNLALNFLNRADQRLSCPLEDMFSAEMSSLTRTIEDSHLSQEKFRTLCQAIGRLPPACRRVFIYKKIYGMSQKEIAARLGISNSMVEKHVEKGMSVTIRHMLDSGQFDSGEVKRARSRKEARRP